MKLLTTIFCLLIIYQSFSQPFTKIRVAVNLIVDENGNGGFTQFGCTLTNQADCPSLEYNAFDFAKDLINKSNALLSQNGPLNLGNGYLFKTDQSNQYGDWFDANFGIPQNSDFGLDVPFRYELGRVNVYYRDCSTQYGCHLEFTSAQNEEALYADEMNLTKQELAIFIYPDNIAIDSTPQDKGGWAWHGDQYITGALGFVFGEKSGCNLNYVNALNHEVGHELGLLHGDSNNNQNLNGSIQSPAYGLDPCYALELSLYEKQQAGFNMESYYNSLTPVQQNTIDECYIWYREESRSERHFEDGRNHSQNSGIFSTYDQLPNLTTIQVFKKNGIEVSDITQFSNNIVEAGVGWYYPLAYNRYNINRAESRINSGSSMFTSAYPIVNINTQLNNAVFNSNQNGISLANNMLRRISGQEAVTVSNKINLQQPEDDIATIVELISEKQICFNPGTEILPDEQSYLCAYIDPTDHFNSAESPNSANCNFNPEYLWDGNRINTGTLVNQRNISDFNKMMESGTMCAICQQAIEEKEGLKIQGIAENYSEHIMAYPDPFVNHLTVEWHTQNIQAQNATLSLVDVNGKILSTQPFNNKALINTTGLQKGVYTLRINTIDKIIHQKVVKIK